MITADIKYPFFCSAIRNYFSIIVLSRQIPALLTIGLGKQLLGCHLENMTNCRAYSIVLSKRGTWASATIRMFK
jgi:hypothetical protein